MVSQPLLENGKLNYKIWLSSADGKGIMGDGKWKILKAIEQLGSLRAATQSLGLTYRRTWGDLKKIEKELGFPLIVKSRGGSKGGKTVLTDQGKKLVKAFDRLHYRTDVLMEEAFKEFWQSLR